MFRKTVDSDISDENFKNILVVFNNNYSDFLEKYIMTKL